MTKAKEISQPQPVPHSKQEGGTGCLVRLCWMLFGNFALLVTTIIISKRDGFSLSSADLAFWLIVLFLAGIRYIDITRLEGTTVTLKPASRSHWRQYTLYLGLFAFLLWIVAHTVAYVW